jgi:hypothetical protein
MAHHSALAVLALASALASPGHAIGREFMDGAGGHCLLCDYLFGSQKSDGEGDGEGGCRQPTADSPASHRQEERTGSAN